MVCCALLWGDSQGKFVTSRNLRDRLYRELERNLAMKVEDGDTADVFLVSGRGTLHITILIENMYVNFALTSSCAHEARCRSAFPIWSFLQRVLSRPPSWRRHVLW